MCRGAFARGTPLHTQTSRLGPECDPAGAGTQVVTSMYGRGKPCPSPTPRHGAVAEGYLLSTLMVSKLIPNSPFQRTPRSPALPLSRICAEPCRLGRLEPHLAASVGASCETSAATASPRRSWLFSSAHVGRALLGGPLGHLLVAPLLGQLLGHSQNLRRVAIFDTHLGDVAMCVARSLPDLDRHLAESPWGLLVGGRPFPCCCHSPRASAASLHHLVDPRARRLSCFSLSSASSSNRVPMRASMALQRHLGGSQRRPSGAGVARRL